MVLQYMKDVQAVQKKVGDMVETIEFINIVSWLSFCIFGLIFGLIDTLSRREVHFTKEPIQNMWNTL